MGAAHKLTPEFEDLAARVAEMIDERFRLYIQQETIAVPKFVPLSEVAEQLGVTVETVRGWSAKKEFPRCHFFGGRWNVSVKAVDTWLETCPGDPDQDELRKDFGECAAAPNRKKQNAPGREEGVHAP